MWERQIKEKNIIEKTSKPLKELPDDKEDQVVKRITKNQVKIKEEVSKKVRVIFISINLHLLLQ